MMAVVERDPYAELMLALRDRQVVETQTRWNPFFDLS
jgi:hypothetical protein